MKNTLLAGLAAAGLALGLPVPAEAAPIRLQGSVLPAYKPAPPLIKVDKRRGHRNRGYYTYRGKPYYNGHRGWRHQRRGYRRYNGWWYPPAAFAFSFGVAPVPRYLPPAPRYVAPPRYGRGLSPAHYHWCQGRYRSYRAYDNTFQPYHGPRRGCFSPYGP